jgi:hypothetical protein
MVCADIGKFRVVVLLKILFLSFQANRVGR